MNQTLLRYIPWAIGNAISMITFTMLYTAPGLDTAEGFLEISQIMADQGNNSLSSISSLVMLIAQDYLLCLMRRSKASTIDLQVLYVCM